MRQENQSSMAAVALLIFVIASVKVSDGASGIQVDVFPRNPTLRVGQNFTLMCRVARQIQYCRIKLPGLDSALNLQEGTRRDNDFWYAGEGLRSGQCGVTIARIDDRHNGQFMCSMGIPGESMEASGITNVTVARAPAFEPVLEVSPEPDRRFRAYNEDITIKAMCTVREARPAANIAWFMGDDQINDGLTRLETVETPNELFTVRQNLTRRLTWKDSGKNLKCVASHIALDDRPKQTVKQIFVRFAPRPVSGPIEQFGFIVGEEGIITVQIHANPKPRVTWSIDQDRISENSFDPSERFQALPVRDMGNSTWIADLRIMRVSVEDVERRYELTAENEVGTERYIVKISTSTEPEESLELGTGPIIGIVVAILVLLIIVFMLIFARATGRWCFSAGGAGRSGTSHSSSEAHIDPENQQPVHTEKTKSGHHTEGEGGMENPSVNHNVSTEYINGNNPQDTKKSDKDTPV